MEYHQLSAAAFADAIQVGRSSISHILSGRNKPSLEFVMKIIDAFPEVELYWLLNGTGTYPKTTPPPIEKKVELPPTPEKTATVPDKTLTDLFSSTEIPSTFDKNPLTSEKKETFKNTPSVERIVIFYTDGTFDSYVQNKS